MEGLLIQTKYIKLQGKIKILKFLGVKSQTPPNFRNEVCNLTFCLLIASINKSLALKVSCVAWL